MHQLHRTRNGTECGKCQEKFPAAQALRFLLIVMLISIVFFLFIRVDSRILQLVLRLLLIPVIAGVSYEFIRLAGRYDNRLVNILSKPGLWMQKMTTKEPDDEMIEVGIASVEAVFDWRKWQKEENV